MGRQPVTRLQISGYRFLLRRMEHGLVRGDVRMLDDPLRAQSLAFAAGIVLATIAVTGCAVLAVLRPQGQIGAAPIVMDRDSGAIYVRIDDTLHPADNLASARLVAGTPADPQPVSTSALRDAKRGPAVGIPGAPALTGDPLPAQALTWTVCDGEATTVSVGTPVTGDRLTAGRAVLARPADAATTYLLYDGVRAAVDLRATAVVRAMRLDGVAPQPLSRALLDAVPEVPAIAAPPVPAAGTPGPAPFSEVPVGTVVRLVRAEVSEFYVVLTDGVQRVGRIAADLIRFTVGQPHREIRTVSADAIAATPIVDTLPVGTFPDRIETGGSPVVCAQWTGSDTGGQPDVAVLLRDSMPAGPAEVSLARADGAGPEVDAVALPPGRSAYVRATGLAGDGGVAGSLFLVTDTGVVFGIADEQAAAALGLAGDAPAAPWPVLARLPRGPELSPQAASVVRDGIA